MKTVAQYLMIAAVAMLVNYPQFGYAGQQKTAKQIHRGIASVEPADVQSFAEKYVELKNKWEKFGEFFDHIKGQMHPKYAEYFLSKVERSKWRDQQIPDIKAKENILFITEDGLTVKVELIAEGNVIARINGVDFTQEDLPNPKSYWEKIDRVLGTKKSAYHTGTSGFYGLFAQLMVPQAHAFLGLGSMGIIILLALALFAGYQWGKSSTLESTQQSDSTY